MVSKTGYCTNRAAALIAVFVIFFVLNAAAALSPFSRACLVLAAERRSAEEITSRISSEAAFMERKLGLTADAFWAQRLCTGSPRPVRQKGVTVAFEVPMMAPDCSSRMVYLSRYMDRILVPPSRNEAGGRTLLTAREWNEISAVPSELPASGFSPQPQDYSSPAFPYLYRERLGGIYELLGVIPGEAALRDFKMIRFVDSVPQRFVPGVVPQGSSGGGLFRPMKSFSYAASYCADWWRIAGASTSEVIFGAYIDNFSKKTAFGTDPRVLDALYSLRASEKNDFFSFSATMSDPVVRSEKVQSSVEAYASLLVLPEEKEFTGPSGDRRYVIDETDKFFMDDEYITLFECFDGTDEALIEALSAHGIVLAGVPFYSSGVPSSYPAKAVAIIGYARAGMVNVFAYRDFEDRPGVLRVAPASFFREAYCFPHEFRAKARYVAKNRKLYVETFDSRGARIDVDSISATFPSKDKKVKFFREAQGVYFHQVKKEDFSGVERAVLDCELKKDYYTRGEEDSVIVRYAIY